LVVYEAEWTTQAPEGYISWEQFSSLKQNNLRSGNRTVPTTTPSRAKQYVPSEEDQDCGGICACFKVRKPPQTRPPGRPEQPQPSPASQQIASQAPRVLQQDAAKRRPLVYSEKELGEEGAGRGENPLLRQEGTRKLSYYSKGYHRSR
jgi:hypothetical protein